jgi:hypothetical protein
MFDFFSYSDSKEKRWAEFPKRQLQIPFATTGEGYGTSLYVDGVRVDQNLNPAIPLTDNGSPAFCSTAVDVQALWLQLGTFPK